MSVDIDLELNTLKSQILQMGSLIEGQIENSIKCLVETDLKLAEQAIESDRIIDSADIEIDETCIRLLSLYHPMASKLRFITTAMKISTELERMGNLTVAICKQSIALSHEPLLKPYIDIPRMANSAMTMVKEALNAFVNHNIVLSEKVLSDDTFIDECCDRISGELVSYMVEDSTTITRATQINFVSTYIERIGNHATNIASMTFYLVKGTTIRHT